MTRPNDEIPGLEVTFIEPVIVEPEDLVNLDAIYLERLAHARAHCRIDPCVICDDYERILDRLLVP